MLAGCRGLDWRYYIYSRVQYPLYIAACNTPINIRMNYPLYIAVRNTLYIQPYKVACIYSSIEYPFGRRVAEARVGPATAVGASVDTRRCGSAGPSRSGARLCRGDCCLVGTADRVHLCSYGPI